MIKYNDQPCPGCGRHMHEGDDIVVCPECATPQHRECWMAEGHCVNESLHSPDFVWQPREKISLDEPSKSGRLCHICGAENLPEALHCGRCGALLSEEKADEESEKECRFCGEKNPASNRLCSKCGAPLLFENNFFQNNIYMKDVDAPEDEPLGETTVGEAAYFIQNSTKRYIPKFKKIASGRKISFNLGAFLFSPWWFFYRKLYKAGVIILVLFTSITFMTYKYQSQILSASETMESTLSAIQEQYKDSANDETLLTEAVDKETEVVLDFVNQVKKPAAIILIIIILEHLACGFAANLIYYKKMKDIIDKVKETDAPDEIKKSLLIRTGGISFISLAAGFFGGEILTSAISYIANAIIGSM